MLRRPLSRRAVLAGAGVLGLSGAAAATAGYGVDRVVDRVLPPSVPVLHGPTGPVVQDGFDSAAMRRRTRYVVVYPPGARAGDALPLTLVLHGRGGDAGRALDPMYLPQFLGAAVRAGTPPFALVSVDGGDHSYWHRRSDGTDAQAMLLDELLPRLAARGLRTRRVGLQGTSMGGYGALLLAETVPERCAAVVVDAAALWRRPRDAAPGAFDNATDFHRHDVLAGSQRLRGLPLRVSCGRSDPFLSTNRALARALAAESSYPRGGHEESTWRQVRPRDLHFLGTHLAA